MRASREIRSGLWFYLGLAMVAGLLFAVYPSVLTGVILAFSCIALAGSIRAWLWHSGRGRRSPPNANRGRGAPPAGKAEDWFLDVEEDTWVLRDRAGFLFRLPSGKEPAAELVAFVRSVQNRRDSFLSEVRELLALEQAKYAMRPDAAREIAGLSVECVCVLSPIRAMVYFAGGSDDRVWHCDLTPDGAADLTFDD